MSGGRIVPEPDDSPSRAKKPSRLGIAFEEGPRGSSLSQKRFSLGEDDEDAHQRRRGAGADRAALDLSDVADQLELLSYSTVFGRFKHKMGEFLEHPLVEMFIIFLVFAYSLLVCGMLVADQEIEDRPERAHALNVVDVVVNVVFLLEIALKSLAFGQPFYSDPMNVVDGVLVVLSMSLALVTISTNNEALRKVLSFRGVLRLLRLIVIFRRVSESANTLTKIKSQVQGIDISSPIERVMDTLRQLQSNPRIPRRMRLEVVYAVSVVTSGKLYDVNLDDAQADGRDVKMEASAWVSNVQSGKDGEEAKRKAFDVKVSGIGEYTLSLISAYGPEVQRMLEIAELERWDYDMFELDRLTKQNCLPLMTTRLLKSCGLWDAFIADNNRFEVYFSRIRDGYLQSNPYHNAVHATDVLQTTFWFCNTGELVRIVSADAAEFFAMLFAALVHDVGHPGLNNVWHVKTSHPVAVRYNDKAVLENMHAAIAYSVAIEDDAANIFKTVPRDQFDKIRALVIHLVLATDMTQHFAKLGKLKTRVQTSLDTKTPFPEPGKDEDRKLLMENVLHACDISNPARRTRIYLIWTDKVLQEFFNQGDEEKKRGFAVSNFMDRDTTNLAKMQIGFISFVVTPLYAALAPVIGAAAEPVGWLGINRDFWVVRTDEMEEQLKACGCKYTLPAAEDVSQSELQTAMTRELQKLGISSPQKAPSTNLAAQGDRTARATHHH